MDARIKCLNELKKLEKKMRDTRCAHLLLQYEVVYTSFGEVLTMIDNMIFNTPKPIPKTKRGKS